MGLIINNNDKKLRISDTVFSPVMMHLTYDHDGSQSDEAPYNTLIETVGVEANLGLYSFSFYGEKENNFEIIVEDFSKQINGKWIQHKPTKSQLKKMQQVLKDRVYDLQEANNKRIEDYKLIEKEEENERAYGVAGALYGRDY